MLYKNIFVILYYLKLIYRKLGFSIGFYEKFMRGFLYEWFIFRGELKERRVKREGSYY